MLGARRYAATLWNTHKFYCRPARVPGNLPYPCLGQSHENICRQLAQVVFDCVMSHPN
ncbi:hypothetical protein BDV24DRAFT_145194 [Aspergillus arachidicola]|uniref:Uncharacterized protein n=1 Tax=Aspergillus arachidicola TaxID=656916 RepID=A0A5N6XPZ6_9EURO|nr:hypothetical protein BDV24DRAFT_145194 [Aspergillus arachidicola]